MPRKQIAKPEVSGVDLVNVVHTGRKAVRLLPDPSHVQQPVGPELPLRPKV